MVISNKVVHTSCLKSGRTTYYGGNQKRSGKSQNYIELLPSAQPSLRNERFVSTRNVKEFVSNIL